jgi:hypothetical protein
MWNYSALFHNVSCPHTLVNVYQYIRRHCPLIGHNPGLLLDSLLDITPREDIYIYIYIYIYTHIYIMD